MTTTEQRVRSELAKVAHVPACEPYRSRWQALHETHVLLLTDWESTGNEKSLRECPRLADAKYSTYLESLDVMRGREILSDYVPRMRVQGE